MSIIQMLLGGSSAQNLIIPSGVNLNIFQLAGSPSYPANLNVIIPPSSTVGSNNPAVASLTVGSFVAGSNIVIHNYGKILGAGGLINGGVGGTALNANVPSTVTVAVYNYTGGQMKGGGGGGGNGGNGGVGGTGGNGQIGSRTLVSNGEWDQWYAGISGEGVQDGFWINVGGSIVASVNAPSTTTRYGNYYRGSSTGNWSSPDGGYSAFEIFTLYIDTTVATFGGAGGAGGLAGAGGRGQGYDINFQTGSLGYYGNSGGAPSGANAGYGGAGGKGGNGGSGGDWGQSGSNGVNGSPGLVGGNGNVTAGSPGSAGAAGTAGGLGGYYLFKSSTVVFNNAGGIVAGRIN